ncbi:MAG: PA14 domain-containing protein [Myxococcota bacterium]
MASKASGQRAQEHARAALTLLRDRRVPADLALAQVAQGWTALQESIETPWKGLPEKAITAVAQLVDAPPNEVSIRDARQHARWLRRAIRQHRKDLGLRYRPRWPDLVALMVAAAAVATPYFVLVGGGGGPWLGRYYPEMEFRGDPRTRFDEAIDFEWVDGSPMVGFPQNDFTVRWDTCLELEESTTIHLEVGSDDGSRVFVDGERILNNWNDQAGNWVRGDVELAAGKHPIRVEYYEKGGSALVFFRVRRQDGPLPEDSLIAPEDPDHACD